MNKKITAIEADEATQALVKATDVLRERLTPEGIAKLNAALVPTPEEPEHAPEEPAEEPPAILNASEEAREAFEKRLAALLPDTEEEPSFSDELAAHREGDK